MLVLYAALLTPALAGDVLWYTGNDGYAEAVITTLTTTTAALGSAGIDSTDVWPGSFSGYTLVFLVIPTAEFTPAQSADLVAFVVDGGTLVLISDNNAYTPHTASVFNTLGPDLGLGTTFVEDALDKSCGHYATVAATHALTDRLSSGGTTYAKSGDMILSDAATELLTGESGQPLLAVEAGVVLSTDIELLVDSCGLSIDNAQLIENLYYGVCASTDDDDDGDGSYDPYCGGDDCDDTDPARAGGAVEACDGVDNDCDELVPADEVDADGDGLLACAECDDGDPAVPDGITWYRDADGDGFGTGADTVYVCTVPAGYVDNLQDCDDADPDIGPGQPEVCDGRDQDCDGQADEGALDAPLWYEDADGDGYGGALATAACEAPAGTVDNGDDCDDASARVAPGADEYCNGLDDDCDGAADEDGVNADPWYADADGDGYGDSATSTLACDAPEGFVSDSRDCDDSDENIYPGAPGWTVTCEALDTGDPPKTSTSGCGCQGAPSSAVGWLGLALALGATRRRGARSRPVSGSC